MLQLDVRRFESQHDNAPSLNSSTDELPLRPSRDMQSPIPASQEQLTLPALHQVANPASNLSEAAHDDILSSSIKKGQAKRQLFSEIKPLPAQSQKYSLGTATKNVLIKGLYQGPSAADEFDSPHIQAHKRLAALVSDKQRLGNRNLKHDLLS